MKKILTCLVVGLFLFGMVGLTSATPLLYGLSGTTGGNLYSYDTTTGANTYVGSTGFDRYSSLTFGTDGSLYGLTGGNWGEYNSGGYLSAFDITTGESTYVGHTSFDRYSGLAFGAASFMV